MLTAKQEKFVRNLIQGMSQREAYKNSYDAENMTDKSIDEEACRLFKDSKISTRYRELQERLDKHTIMTAQERLEYLTEVIQGLQLDHNDAPADLNIKLKAIDIMNKMQGEYTQKVQAEVTNAVNINIELSDD